MAGIFWVMTGRSALLLALVLLTGLFPAFAGSGHFEGSKESRAAESWTILSYMSGDNNLESDLLDDLNEMEIVGSSSDVNIVVQIDISDEYGPQNVAWTDTRRYLVQKDTTGEIASLRMDAPPYGEQLGELSMNDPATLRDFLVWGFSNFPADHYMVIFEGHADAPAQGMLKDKDSTLGYKHMATDEAGKAFRDAVEETIKRPVDIVSLDVCWMGMAGASAEFMDHALYILASFDYVPGAGWPYDICLPKVYDGSLTMEERLSRIVDLYVEEYTQGENEKDYASLAAIDLGGIRDEFVPGLSKLSTDLFYTANENRELYESLIGPVDKPLDLDGSTSNSRYLDAYQFFQFLSGDPRVPVRVRNSASAILSTEDDVIVHSSGGPNHPKDSRLLGIYLPEKWDAPLYSDLVLSDLTPWDDLIRLHVRNIDIEPQGFNWSSERPETHTFGFWTYKPDEISKAWVEVLSAQGYTNVTLIGSGGLFSGKLKVPDVEELRFRYRIDSVYGGTIDYPPDGMTLVSFGEDSEPPEVEHTPPQTLEVDLDSGGLTFFIRDDTGIKTSVPTEVPRIEYREAGSQSWYSIPLSQKREDGFTGWIEYWALPSGMTPGEVVEYHVVVRDIDGNQGRYPSSGEWTTTMGVGGRFYLDSYRSFTGNHQGLIDAFMDLGMSVEMRVDGSGLSDLDGYKGYILIEPKEAFGGDDMEDLTNFIEGGGELLLIIDPGDPDQIANGYLLMEELSISTTDGGEVNGFYPSNPSSELGSPLPKITGQAKGSFVLGEGQVPAYYTSPPFASLFTAHSGYGRIVATTPYMLSDNVIGRTSNDLLADIVITYLFQNVAPVVQLKVGPSDVVKPGEVVTIDLSGSHDTDGTLAQYSFSSSDGTVKMGTEPVFQHSYESSGLYTITGRVWDYEEGEASATASIRVNSPPDTDMGLSTNKAHAGEDIIFSYKGRDPEGDDIIVEWDFGDGYKVAGQVVKHAYRTKGIFTYTLRVRDIWGQESRKNGTITIENSDPVIVLDKERITVNGLPGNFSGSLKVTLYVEEGDLIEVHADTSYDPDQGDELNYTWKMGDGIKLYGSEVVHSYLGSGLMNMNLTLTDGYGGIDHYLLAVFVTNRAPFAVFNWSGDGRKVVFDGSLSADDSWDLPGLIYEWDFGDGEKVTTDKSRVEHEYSFGGSYRVRLTVIDGDGAESVYTRNIEVQGWERWHLIVVVIAGAAVLASVMLLMYVRYRSGLRARSVREMEEVGPEEGPSRRARIRGFSRPEPVEKDRGGGISRSPSLEPPGHR
ncbi:MAG: PKD domain-containing protein [Thermoplasmatota archaeon]